MTGLSGRCVRVVITRPLLSVHYARRITKFLNANHMRIVDYAEFADPVRDRVHKPVPAPTT
jgi:hypothetical protein